MKCANCKKPATEEYKPFCGQRCKDVDLHRWFSEGYVVESEEIPLDEDEG